jgi:hypothetical protein
MIVSPWFWFVLVCQLARHQTQAVYGGDTVGIKAMYISLAGQWCLIVTGILGGSGLGGLIGLGISNWGNSGFLTVA